MDNSLNPFLEKYLNDLSFSSNNSLFWFEKSKSEYPSKPARKNWFNFVLEAISNESEQWLKDPSFCIKSFSNSKVLIFD